MLLALGLAPPAVSMVACSGSRYAPPESGPTATLTVASSCLVSPARFFARINRQRTDTYGCNQTAAWLVVPGHIQLEIQVEEAQYTVEPLVFQFDIREGECANFLLRQREGYDLEVFGIGACD